MFTGVTVPGGRLREENRAMNPKMPPLTLEGLHTSEFDNIRELLEMLMSEHTPAKHKIKMKTSFGWEPPMNVFETETQFVVIMDISGMDQKDIAVATDGSILRISGVRKDLIPPGKKQFHSLEIQVGPFQRLIGIPSAVDVASITTRYDNGLLEIRLKKSGDGPGRRRVEIE
jgi:HSP20 family protein